MKSTLSVTSAVKHKSNAVSPILNTSTKILGIQKVGSSLERKNFLLFTRWLAIDSNRLLWTKEISNFNLVGSDQKLVKI